VSAIKPPGGPGASGVTPPPVTSGPTGATGPDAASFRDRLGAQEAVAKTGAQANVPTPGTTEHVIESLRAGKITPDAAVTALTKLAVQRTGAPEALHAQLEARLREMVAQDPIVGDLVRQMGGAVANDE